MRVNSNIASLMAQNQLARTSKAIVRSLERLASGRRINGGRDDASGLAISTRLEASVRGYARATLNINEAFGSLQSADSALGSMQEIIQRMRELSVQAATGTMSNKERAYLNTEVQQLYEEFDRIRSQSSFRGVNLFDGSLDNFSLQVGPDKGQSINLGVTSMTMSDAFARTRTLGSGSFTAKGTYNIGGYPSHIDLADLTGDGHVDAFGANYTHSGVHVWAGIAGGTFSDLGDQNGNATQYQILADFNGDGIQDVLGIEPTQVTAKVYLSNGSGGFTQSATLSPGAAIRNGVTTDVNGDGRKDIVLSSEGGTNAWVYMNNGTGGFSLSQTLAVGTGNTSMSNRSVGDINGDGREDLVIANRSSQSVSVFLNAGNGTYSQGTTLATNAQLQGPWGPRLVDMTGDGKLDMFVTGADTGTVGIYKGNGDGTFTFSQTFSAISANSDLTMDVRDFNEDGYMDILYSNPLSEITYLATGSASGSFSIARTFSGEVGQLDLNWTGDINNDGHQDFMLVNQTNKTFTSYFGNGDGTFDLRGTTSTGNGAVLSNLVDMNGDGFLDFALQNRTDQNFVSYIQGSGSYTDHPVVSVSTQSQAQVMLDMLTESLTSLSVRRANLGAEMSRLESSANLALLTQENLSAALSNMRDTDVAAETAELAKNQILQQAQTAVLGQSNLQLQLVLQLLRF